MNITWSGYNGTHGHKGNEYITITGETSEMLVMKVFGYQAGEADVTYSWGNAQIDFTIVQHLRANKIISIFENETPNLQYDYIEHIIDDQHGYTAGIAGYTSATGDMLEVIEKYTQIKSNNVLRKYIPELERLNDIYIENNYELSEEGANVNNLQGLVDDWKIAAEDSRFRKLQDDERDRMYYYPALSLAISYDIKYPLTLLNIYDAVIQHGVDGVKDIIKKINLPSPREGGDEIAWLKAFNTQRYDVMMNTIIDGVKIWEDSVYRVKVLNNMINKNNYYLEPFTLIIDDWEESFVIS